MRYQIAGKMLECGHCQKQSFSLSTAQLNSSFMSFVDLDWLDPSAKILQCDHCKKIEWFSGSADILEFDDLVESDCLACGKFIPDGETECSRCGWTYI